MGTTRYSQKNDDGSTYIWYEKDSWWFLVKPLIGIGILAVVGYFIWMWVAALFANHIGPFMHDVGYPAMEWIVFSEKIVASVLALGGVVALIAILSKKIAPIRYTFSTVLLLVLTAAMWAGPMLNKSALDPDVLGGANMIVAILGLVLIIVGFIRTTEHASVWVVLGVLYLLGGITSSTFWSEQWAGNHGIAAGGALVLGVSALSLLLIEKMSLHTENQMPEGGEAVNDIVPQVEQAEPTTELKV